MRCDVCGCRLPDRLDPTEEVECPACGETYGGNGGATTYQGP